MNKKTYSLLTTIFTIVIVIVIYLFGGGKLLSSNNNTTTKSDTINGIQIKGDTTRYPVQFIRKVDGDTIKVKFNNQELTVRYLMIDTPETVKENTAVQPYGPEASARNEEILKNAKKVELEFDVYQKKDHYDRAVAYVYADGKLVAEQLLREGLAEIKYAKEPDTRYLPEYTKAQNEAKANKRNIWSGK